MVWPPTVCTNRCTASRSTRASGWTQRCGEVEHAAAADRGQLMPVADQRHPGTGLVRDGQQGAGGVLIQHPGLIHQQQIARAKPGFLARAAIDRAGDRVHIARL